MLKRVGYYILLFPVGLVDSLVAMLMGASLYVLSLSVNRRITPFDWVIAALGVTFLYAWFGSGESIREFVVPQLSGYIVFSLALRFLYVCRQDLLRFISEIPLTGYLALCGLYLLVQLKVGYTYEVGTLEAFLLIRLVLVERQRVLYSGLLLLYFFLMFLISTRTTPLFVALMVLVISFAPVPRRLLKYGYLAVIAITPFVGTLLMSVDLFSEELAAIDDNAEIRLEMIKGATVMMGWPEFLIGTGFGQPFRDMHYEYAFWHPLLNEHYWVHQVSNHNSLFDVFLRCGIFVYIAFSVCVLRVLSLPLKASRHYYALIFVGLYSLCVNAYLDSTRLTVAYAMLTAGIMFALRYRAECVVASSPAENAGAPANLPSNHSGELTPAQLRNG